MPLAANGSTGDYQKKSILGYSIIDKTSSGLFNPNALYACYNTQTGDHYGSNNKGGGIICDNNDLIVQPLGMWNYLLQGQLPKLPFEKTLFDCQQAGNFDSFWGDPLCGNQYSGSLYKSSNQIRVYPFEELVFIDWFQFKVPAITVAYPSFAQAGTAVTITGSSTSKSTALGGSTIIAVTYEDLSTNQFFAAIPDDGAFNSITEQFSFTLMMPSVPGAYSFLVRAYDSFYMIKQQQISINVLP